MGQVFYNSILVEVKTCVDKGFRQDMSKIGHDVKKCKFSTRNIGFEDCTGLLIFRDFWGEDIYNSDSPPKCPDFF
jgi:hypothetical protein